MSATTLEKPAVLGGCWPAHLEAVERSAAWKRVPGAAELRTQGATSFRERGFPSTDDEEWRYTSVENLVKVGFRQSLEPKADALVANTAKMFTFGLEKAPRLVMVDGFFSKELSSLGGLPAGVIACGLAEAMDKHRALVEPRLGKFAKPGMTAFTSLNTALFQDGAFVHVPEGVVVERPLVILHLSHESYLASHPRHLFVLGAGAQISLVEAYASPSCDLYFTNAVTEVDLARGARLQSVRIEAESGNAFHVANTQSRLAEGSLFQHCAAITGAEFFRHDLGSLLAGERAEAQFFGLTIASGKQHIDHHTVIDHAVPNCPSREFYKAILNGRSHVVFNGKVFVREDAQKTDAKQTNKNLLLSDDARVDTKPQLEIFADDVKCTHGATIGPLDEESIYYCRSRGIAPEIARGILTYAFARDVLQHFAIPEVCDWLDKSMVQRLLDAGRTA
ncbi:MAG: Fe-S cluster assembly protein SufD [Planctomycetes bacterium]|nr:Fe-S cluster assembly protein SufD [Planctomycetota bacterium]